jgi:uncharacterized protein
MFGEEKILDSIATLSRAKQLAFALLVFERMLPSLTAFSMDTGFDDSCYLRGREAAWDSLRDWGRDRIDQSLREDCRRGAPDTEAFSHQGTSYALNAALAMSDTLDFILEGDLQQLADILTLATDSVYFFIVGLGPSPDYLPELKEVAAHPLMKQELLRQKEDLRFLSALPDRFDEAAVSALRTRVGTQAPLIPLGQ